VLLFAALALAAPPLRSAQEAPGRPERFSFVVVGHTRGGPGNGVIPHERLDELIAEVRRLAPDFVVLTGDLIYGDIFTDKIDTAAVRADWEAVDRELEKFGVPVHRAPGNHDVWEPDTRDIWLERYGPLYRSFDFGGCRFLLLCSSWSPEPGDPGQCPPRYIRGAPLDPQQVEFVARELAGASSARHVFVLMHHMLWWEPDAPWWRDVHPLLAAAPTRAVFAGDLGPWKFSHEKRDGIDYIQSSVEFTVPPMIMLQTREESRRISAQLDNFVVVSVDGADVSYEVRTLGALTTGRFTPKVWQDVNEYDKGSFQRKLYNRMDTPARVLRGLLIAGAAAFAAGAVSVLALVWLVPRLRGRRG